MRKTMFGGVTAAGLALSSSFANADVLTILTVSNGMGAGVSTLQTTVPDIETCKKIAHNAAVASPYPAAGASVSCIPHDRDTPMQGYLCNRTNYQVICQDLK